MQLKLSEYPLLPLRSIEAAKYKITSEIIPMAIQAKIAVFAFKQNAIVGGLRAGQGG